MAKGCQEVREGKREREKEREIHKERARDGERRRLSGNDAISPEELGSTHANSKPNSPSLPLGQRAHLAPLTINNTLNKPNKC